MEKVEKVIPKKPEKREFDFEEYIKKLKKEDEQNKCEEQQCCNLMAEFFKDIIRTKGFYSETLIIELDEKNLTRERRLGDDALPAITTIGNIKTKEGLYQFLHKIQEENRDLDFSFEEGINEDLTRWIKYTVRKKQQK